MIKFSKSLKHQTFSNNGHHLSCFMCHVWFSLLQLSTYFWQDWLQPCNLLALRWKKWKTDQGRIRQDREGEDLPGTSKDWLGTARDRPGTARGRAGITRDKWHNVFKKNQSSSLVYQVNILRSFCSYRLHFKSCLFWSLFWSSHASFQNLLFVT